MATTDSNGIVFLEETDPISPFHTTMNVLQQGTSDALSGIRDGSNDILVVHQVADTSERSSLAAAYGPTASKPLYVDRQDAPAGQKLERTEDGSTWAAVGAPTDTGWVNLTLDAGTTVVDGLTPRIRKINGIVYLSGRVTQGGSTIATIPAGYRPDRDQRQAVTLGNSGTATGVLVYTSSTAKIGTAAGATVNLDEVRWPGDT